MATSYSDTPTRSAGSSRHQQSLDMQPPLYTYSDTTSRPSNGRESSSSNIDREHYGGIETSDANHYGGIYTSAEDAESSSKGTLSGFSKKASNWILHNDFSDRESHEKNSGQQSDVVTKAKNWILYDDIDGKEGKNRTRQVKKERRARRAAEEEKKKEGRKKGGSDGIMDDGIAEDWVMDILQYIF